MAGQGATNVSVAD